ASAASPAVPTAAQITVSTADAAQNLLMDVPPLEWAYPPGSALRPPGARAASVRPIATGIGGGTAGRSAPLRRAGRPGWVGARRCEVGSPHRGGRAVGAGRP